MGGYYVEYGTCMAVKFFPIPTIYFASWDVTCTNSGVLSFTVLQKIELEILEPLHLLML